MLSDMILDLIVENDQVGLPGVGTFVADVAPATFSDRGFTINPPYRRLFFYPSCMEENLLVRMYAESNNLDEETSRTYILNFLLELKEVLKDRKSITFPGLGRLRMTKKNTVFFVADENLDIYPEGVGLPAVSLKTHVLLDDDEEVTIGAPFFRPAQPEDPEQAEEPEQPAQLEQPADNESEPAADDESEPMAAYEPEFRMKWWMWAVIAFSVIIVLLAAFLITAELAPDFVDSLLYSTEELRIINY